MTIWHGKLPHGRLKVRERRAASAVFGARSLQTRQNLGEYFSRSVCVVFLTLQVWDRALNYLAHD